MLEAMIHILAKPQAKFVLYISAHMVLESRQEQSF
jgi:hypothetical protein